MHIFEIFIISTLLLTLIGNFLSKKRRPRWLVFLPGLAALLVVVHLFFYKYQWQMVLVYILTAILFLIGLIGIIKVKQKETAISEQSNLEEQKPDKPALDQPKSRKGKIFSYIFTILGLLYLIVATLILFFFPVVDLPKPKGPFSVGTIFINFIDSGHPEILTEDPEDFREFTARVWYPADSTGQTKPLFYRERITQVGLLDSAGPPSFIFGHYNLIRTNSHLDLPISNQQFSYPVLIFSNGFLAFYDDYQILMEELASHGYIIFALNQPYESQSVVWPDGRIVPFSQEHFESYRQDQKSTLPLWEKFWTSVDEDEKKEIAKQILDSEIFMDTILRIRTSDIQFVVDEMEKMNSGERNSIFFNKLDLSRLGILGHSMGGAVAGQVCLLDNRFKAGVNMDGFQWGDVIDGEVQQPFMVMQSEPFAGVNGFILEQFKNKLYLVTVEGSKHMNFDDNQVIMPGTKIIGMTGKINADKMRQITNDYLLSFFDKYLNNKDISLPNEVSSNYPEVKLEIFNP